MFSVCQVLGVVKATTNAAGGATILKGLTGYVWKSLSNLNSWNSGSRISLVNKLSSRDNVLEFKRSQTILNKKMKRLATKVGRPLKLNRYAAISSDVEDEWFIEGIEMDVGPVANILPGSPHFKKTHIPYRQSSSEKIRSSCDADDNLAHLWEQYSSKATSSDSDSLKLVDLWEWQNEDYGDSVFIGRSSDPIHGGSNEGVRLRDINSEIGT